MKEAGTTKKGFGESNFNASFSYLFNSRSLLMFCCISFLIESKSSKRSLSVILFLIVIKVYIIKKEKSRRLDLICLKWIKDSIAMENKLSESSFKTVR